jgi:type I restriction enzyme M protein
LSEEYAIFSNREKELISKLSDEDFIRLINTINGIKEYPIVDELLSLPAINRLFHRDVIPYPKEIVKLLLGILRSEKFSEAYNPYPGLYRFAYHLSKEFNIPVYTEDFIPSSIPYLMNILNDVQIESNFSNPLENPSFKEGYTLSTFDISVSFPPLNVRGEVPKDIYGRFKVSREGRRGSLDVANIEHVLAQTKSKAIIFVSPGLLNRSVKDETELRKLLVESGILEAVILLPENLLSNTFIPIAVLVVNKNKQAKEVLFIDASVHPCLMYLLISLEKFKIPARGVLNS